MNEPADHKYKGTRGTPAHQGLGRLRRANSKTPARLQGWERHHDNSDFTELHADRARTGHGGETLLARFNRLVQGGGISDAPGEPGEICAIVGTSVMVRGGDHVECPCQVRQVIKKRIAGVKNPLCVGDRVRFQRTDEGGVITAIEPRRNQLERADSHNRALIHVFAANLDCLVIVTAIDQTAFKPGLVDRYLVIAAANGIPAALVINKCDLADAGAAAALYRSLGLPTFAVAARTSSGDVPALKAHLSGKTCVVAGQSGVGKSSLVNALYPDIAARVGAIAHAGFGRHTTSSARSYELSDGVRLIDTPGVRECGITGLQALDVALLYSDIGALHMHCHFADCSHTHEPNCAVLAALAAGTLAQSRYDSYLSIITEDLAES
jgi:ribosome biogenesis GTPase